MKDDQEYIDLMQLRRVALYQGREDVAWQLWEAAQGLVDAGLVSEDAIKTAGLI